MDNSYNSLTVERMTNKLNINYNKIWKKNNYYPNKDEKKKERKSNALVSYAEDRLA